MHASRETGREPRRVPPTRVVPPLGAGSALSIRNFTQSGGAATPVLSQMRQQIASTHGHLRVRDQDSRPESHGRKGHQPTDEARSPQVSEDAVRKVPLPSGRGLWRSARSSSPLQFRRLRSDARGGSPSRCRLVPNPNEPLRRYGDYTAEWTPHIRTQAPGLRITIVFLDEMAQYA